MKFLLLLVARSCATGLEKVLSLSRDKKRQKFHGTCKYPSKKNRPEGLGELKE
jgi:hypothetical protein